MEEKFNKWWFILVRVLLVSILVLILILELSWPHQATEVYHRLHPIRWVRSIESRLVEGSPVPSEVETSNQTAESASEEQLLPGEENLEGALIARLNDAHRTIATVKVSYPNRLLLVLNQLANDVAWSIFEESIGLVIDLGHLVIC